MVRLYWIHVWGSPNRVGHLWILLFFCFGIYLIHLVFWNGINSRGVQPKVATPRSWHLLVSSCRLAPLQISFGFSLGWLFDCVPWSYWTLWIWFSFLLCWFSLERFVDKFVSHVNHVKCRTRVPPCSHTFGSSSKSFRMCNKWYQIGSLSSKIILTQHLQGLQYCRHCKWNGKTQPPA